MSIQKEAKFPVPPRRLFELLTDGPQFSAATGQAAEIESAAGGAFSVFGGRIHGRQIELVPGARIV